MVKVSVIIPVYNTEKYLKQCLDSVINQTLTDIEIICIDDCSTDDSLHILEEYAKNDSRFIIVKNNQNQGTGKNRNYAINMCSGEYIMFLDSDDWFELNACELAYNCIKENDNDIVLFDNYFYYESKNITHFQNRLKPFEKLKKKTNIDLKQVYIPKLFGFYASCMSIYKSNFIKNNQIYFSETVSAEDLPFTVKARILANKVSIINKPLLYYRKARKSCPKRCIDRWEDYYLNHELAYEIINNNQYKTHFMWEFFISSLNGVMKRYDYATKICKRPKEIVFNKTKNILLKWDSEYDVSHIKENIDIKKYNRFLKSKNYKEYEFYENYLSKIFSVRKVHNHISISFLYLKFRMKIS